MVISRRNLNFTFVDLHQCVPYFARRRTCSVLSERVQCVFEKFNFDIFVSIPVTIDAPSRSVSIMVSLLAFSNFILRYYVTRNKNNAGFSSNFSIDKPINDDYAEIILILCICEDERCARKSVR